MSGNFRDIFKEAREFNPDEVFLEPNVTYFLNSPQLLLEAANRIDILKSYIIREQTLNQELESSKRTLVINTEQVKHFDVVTVRDIVGLKLEDKKLYVEFDDYFCYLSYLLSLQRRPFNIADLHDSFVLLGKSRSYYWFMYFPIDTSEPFEVGRFTYNDDEDNLIAMFNMHVYSVQEAYCSEHHAPETNPIEIPPEKISKPITLSRGGDR